MPGPQDNQVGPAAGSDPDPPPPPPPPPASDGSTTPAPPAPTTTPSSADPENPDPPLRQPPPRQPPNEGGCCKNRSGLEKCLLVFLLLIFLLFVAFLIGFVVLYFWRSEPKAYCTEDRCVEAAAKISSFMNRKADPCNNFYEFACGNWIKDTLLPDDQGEVTVRSKMEEDAKAVLKKRLEEENNYLEIAAVQKARDFYASCVDDDRLKKAGSRPFEKLVGMVGKWPSLDDSWNETEFDLGETLLSLSRSRAFSLLPMLSVELKADFEDPTTYVIYIGEGRLGMENATRDFYLEDRDGKELKAYQNMLQQLLVKMGAEEGVAADDARDVVDFEIQLANISMSEEQRQNNLFKVTSIDQLETEHPDFDWASFTNGLVQYGPAPPQITSADRIVLTSPSYISKLFPLLDKTDPRVQANYMMSSLWRHAAHAEPFMEIVQDYTKKLTGRKTSPSRWETCVQLTDAMFPEVTGRLFVQSSFGREQRDHILDLVKSLKTVLIDMLSQTEWLIPESRKRAVDKAKALKARIGYPDTVLNDRYLTDKFEQYNMTKKNFFQNTLRVAYLKNAEKITKFRNFVSEDKWTFSAASVKAFYDPQSNELVFPAGIAQPPVYDSSYPRSMNYGGIGSFIAREMTHGFDDTGREYDKDGQARLWWSKADLASYELQTECMVNHYSCFRWKPARMNIDGLRTLAENVADNGGLKQSYRAYRHWVEQQGIEERNLPGLNLTHNQLFFISFAQMYCTQDNDEHKVYKILTDSYAPAPYRVRGSVQNSIEFAEAFQCAEGAAMNPQTKCKVW